MPKLCAGEQTAPDMEGFTPTSSEIGTIAKVAGVNWQLLTQFHVHINAYDKHVAALKLLFESFGSGSGIVEDLDLFEVWRLTLGLVLPSVIHDAKATDQAHSRSIEYG